MRRSTFVVLLIVTMAITIFTTGRVSSAQDDTLNIPANTVIRGTPGDVVELGRIPVDSSRAGPLCTWQATVTNQTSVHPNSDILLESNGTTLVLADVEATPNKITSNSGSVWLADEVVVSVRLGPAGLFSGRMVVRIDYSNCPPETTGTTQGVSTTQAVTTTESVSTTQAVTTTEGVSTTQAVTTTEGVSTTQAVSTTETTQAPTTPTVVETSTATTEDTQVEGPEVSATDTSVVSTTAETVAPPTTAAPSTTGTEELPVTGSELTIPLLVSGSLILAAGLVLISGVRRRQA
jgi:hypothetical protein